MDQSTNFDGLPADEPVAGIQPLEQLLDAAASLPAGVNDEQRRRIGDLIERIKESADKLVLDNTSRGDLKILSRTLRELRYAFKVFSPYRGRRKVTVFGSARTQKFEPAYEQAFRCGKAMADHHGLVVPVTASGSMILVGICRRVACQVCGRASLEAFGVSCRGV